MPNFQAKPLFCALIDSDPRKSAPEPGIGEGRKLANRVERPSLAAVTPTAARVVRAGAGTGQKRKGKR
jgi:hypothetical protein